MLNWGILNKTEWRWQQSTLSRSMRVLSRTDQRKLISVAFFQVFMASLDLLGVVAIGLLGALSVTGLQSQQPSGRVSSALELMHLSDLTFEKQAILLGASSVFILVGRTILSIIFTRRILFFLSRRGAIISATLISKLLSQSLLTIQTRTTQKTLYAVTRGVELIVLSIIATAVVLVADLSLLVVMAIGLFLLDPTTAISTFLLFSLIGFLLFRFMHVRAGALGLESSRLNIASNEKIVEVFGSYRESVVRNRRNYYAREIGKLRLTLADVTAETSFMPYVSKYIIETSVILGAVLVGVIQFVLFDATHAVATLAVFLASGTRIAPAVLRVQQGSLTIRSARGQATPTLDLIEALNDVNLIEKVDDTLDTIHSGFISTIQLHNISLTYPSKVLPAVSNVSLEIPAGTSVAFVGPSGAGKTTIIDILLGVLTPNEGQVLVSGVPPLVAVSKWPGAVSYVPQDVMIVAGTIRENVALGYPSNSYTDELVMYALKIAHLDQFVLELPQGLETNVGERGAKISGGQRQRLGIARAMFTCPHLLVLDEATSSLDGETESNISQAVSALRGLTTVVMIAHRLSTIQKADLVVYLAEGKIVAKGSFNEVRNLVADFDRQATLMGL
jgi:ABC-type multidrug transport system fused ATPase/permease subunit